MYFPGDFVKFIKTSFLCNISGRRYLVILSSKTIDLPRYNRKTFFFYAVNTVLRVHWNQQVEVHKGQILSQFQNFFVFFYQGFLSQTLLTHRTVGEGRGPSFIRLYHFHPLTNIRHLFATLHMRWLSHIFNRIACIYQTATQKDLPPYRITIWLIDDVMSIYVYLMTCF